MTYPNIYQPNLMRIDSIVDEAPGVKTFRLCFQEPAYADSFSFKAGQFGEYSIFGEGESTFCIASSPTRTGYIECTFRQTGRVTKALARCEVGDTIGFRGPYGNVFPLDQWQGKNLLFIAGGIALPPLRCVIWNALDWRERFSEITVLYGARTAEDIVYKQELDEWEGRGDMRVVQTIDPGSENPVWAGKVGFVPAILEQIAPRSDNTIALVCGPPIMIKRTQPVLESLGFRPEAMFTTLENRMKCGVGKCGRCNVGKTYVCVDGPVFSFEQLGTMPREY